MFGRFFSAEHAGTAAFRANIHGFPITFLICLGWPLAAIHAGFVYFAGRTAGQKGQRKNNQHNHSTNFFHCKWSFPLKNFEKLYTLPFYLRYIALTAALIRSMVFKTDFLATIPVIPVRSCSRPPTEPTPICIHPETHKTPPLYSSLMNCIAVISPVPFFQTTSVL